MERLQAVVDKRESRQLSQMSYSHGSSAHSGVHCCPPCGGGSASSGYVMGLCQATWMGMRMSPAHTSLILSSRSSVRCGCFCASHIEAEEALYAVR